MSSKEDIKLLALNLGIEESIWVKCPFCKAKHEHRMNIKKIVEGILYHCFRASCGRSGFIPGRAQPDQIKKKKEKRKAYPYEGRKDSLPKDIKKWLNKKYSIKDYRGIFWNSNIHFLVFDIHNLQGFCIGNSIKRTIYSNPKMIKANHFPATTTEPFIHFDGPADKDKPVWVVEDFLSARALSEMGQNSVALLGTGLNYEIVTELQKATSVIFLALDADAINLAYRHRKKFHGCFGNFLVISLSNDIKDMSCHERKALLEKAEQGYKHGK